MLIAEKQAPAFLTLVAVAAVASVILLGGGVPDAEAHGKRDTTYGHNYNLDVKYNVNAGVITVDSTNGENFHRYTQAKAWLYDHANHGPTETILGVASDDDTVKFTLTASEHNKFKDKEVGIQFPLQWMRYADGLYVYPGDNSVTRTNVPPVINGSSYDVETGDVSLTVDSNVIQVSHTGICVVVRTYSYPETVSTTCATEATFVNNTNTISANIPVGAGTANTITLEVSKYAIKAANGVWNKAAYSSSLPSRIIDLTAGSGAERIDLSWSAPGSGSSPTTGYELKVTESRGGSGSTWTESLSGTTFAHYSESQFPPGTVVGDTFAKDGVLYEYRVRAVNNMGGGPWSDNSFGSIISSSDTVPAQVSTPTAQLNSAGTAIDVSWTEPDGGGQFVTGYTIEWKVSGATGGTAEDVSGTSWTHDNLTPGTLYEYRVVAENIIGRGPWSNTTSAQAPAAPASITDLTAVPGTTSIQLSWSAPNDGGSAITGYTVEWKATGGNATTVAASGTSWEHTGVTAGTSYEYRVRATNAIGDGAWSNSTSAQANTAPAKITDLAAVPGTTSIQLSWSAPNDGGSAITGYTVEWKAAGGNATTVAASGTSWEHTGVTAGTSYEYRVRATNAIGDGAWSNSTSAQANTAPAKITDLAAVPGTTSIQLSWSAPNDGGSAITGYTVEWKAAGGNATTVAASGTSWEHTGVTAGTSYEYRVRATNAIGDGAWSNSTSAQANTAPAKITDLTATAGATVQLFWSAPNDGGSAITGYTVEWKAAGGNATTVPVSGTSWEHTGVTPGTLYEYRVRAANSVGDGPWSDTASAQASAAVPAQITDLAAVAGTTIQLSWSAPNDGGSAITGYTVEWKASGGNATTVAVSGTSWTHSGVTPGTLYEYRVRATNAIGDGAWSNSTSATAV